MTTFLADCERCESPLERGDLRCAICGEAAPAGEAAPETEVVNIEVLRCKGCGAAVEYDPDAQAPQCAFCDSVMKVEKIEDPMEQTGLTLRFTVDEPEARAALRKWFGSLGWFRPSDLRTEARVESLKPLFWVAWVFDATALISWTADSNSGARRSSWAPHSGQVDMVFDDLVVSASRGLSDQETVELASSYDLGISDEGPPSVSRDQGFVIEHFDVQRSQARRRILQGIHTTAVQRVKGHSIPGTRYRKVKTVALLRRLVTRRCALPAYVLAYRYKGRLYRVVISGQDAGRVCGAAPMDWGKVVLVVLLSLVGLAAVVALLILFLGR